MCVHASPMFPRFAIRERSLTRIRACEQLQKCCKHELDCEQSLFSSKTEKKRAKRAGGRITVTVIVKPRALSFQLNETIRHRVTR